jgi:hypothetical protein
MTEDQINQYRMLIEKDLEWRTKEIALFSNQMIHFRPIVSSEEEIKRTELNKKRFRKLLVLILYAHFEGFFRYAFSQYVHAINDANIDISKAIDRLVVSSLYGIFEDYDIPNKWIDYDSSDFSKINKRIANRQVLFEKIKKIESEKLKLHISDDHKDTKSIVSMESNLSYDVIDKVLYRLGLELSDFYFDDTTKYSLSQFLEKRNSISHGDGRKYKDGIEERHYNSYKKLFDDTVRIIPIVITNCLREKRYLKPEYRDSQ